MVKKEPVLFILSEKKYNEYPFLHLKYSQWLDNQLFIPNPKGSNWFSSHPSGAGANEENQIQIGYKNGWPLKIFYCTYCTMQWYKPSLDKKIDTHSHDYNETENTM